MPAGKKQQSSTMITLVIFVALFFVAAILAVVFYMNSENQRTRGTDLQGQLDNLAKREEVSVLDTLVGARESGQSWLGTMVDCHNRVVRLLLGAPGKETTSAEVKATQAQTRVAETIQLAQKYIEAEKIDPNTGLVSVTRKLTVMIDALKTSGEELKTQIAGLQKRLDDTVAASQDKEKALADEKEQIHQQLVAANAKYDELKQMMEQTSEERVKTLMGRLDQETANAKQLNQDLLKAQAELDLTHQRLKAAVAKLQKIEGAPDRGAVVYKPEGKITVVDEQAGVVYLNLGSKDRIYIGLTFAVYDASGLVPKDGKSKAEVQVFRIMPDTCAARVVNQDPKQPIVTDDVVANLIWDKDKIYKFVVVGDFDINKDGKVEPDGLDAVVRLIDKWGAQSTDELSAQIDAVIIGQSPQVPHKPTAEDASADPTVEQKYVAAQKRLEHYMAVQRLAQGLMIPILPYDTFLYLVGYRGQINKPGAF